MKTLTLAEIHADPHCLDALIHAGEPVEFVEEGRAIARLTPAPNLPAAHAKTPAFSGAAAVARMRKLRAEIWGDEEPMSEEESAAMLDRIRAERRAGLEP